MNPESHNKPTERKKLRRFDMKKLLANPELRKNLIINGTIATQAREGIDITREQAENSYYVVTEGERAAFLGLVPFKTEAGENDGRHVEFVGNLAEYRPNIRADVALRDFSSIDGSPIAYDKLALLGTMFRDNPRLDPSKAIARQGKATGDDARWVRCFWELPLNADWVPFAKGGEYCRFYSDVYLVLDWSQKNRAALQASGNALPSLEHYF